MSNCEKCKIREKYDQDPRSVIGRIWKWHIGWCPGWKSYLKAMPEARRIKILEKYNQASAI